MGLTNSLQVTDRDDFEDGTINVGVKALEVIEDGEPLSISSANVASVLVASGVIAAISLGSATGGATDGLVRADVIPVADGTKVYGYLTPAIPAAWKGARIGVLKGAGSTGWKFVIAGFLTATDVFAIHSIKDASVGDTNALIEAVYVGPA